MATRSSSTPGPKIVHAAARTQHCHPYDTEPVTACPTAPLWKVRSEGGIVTLPDAAPKSSEAMSGLPTDLTR